MPDHIVGFAGVHALAKGRVAFDSETMSATEILEEMRRMPEAERRELVGHIENEFDGFDDPLTPEEIAELDRRAEDALKHPGRGTPIEEVSAEIRKRILANR